MSNPSHPSATPATPLIQARDVHKSFSLDTQAVDILKGIHLTLNRGEMLALVGASGAGKSTFLHILGTLDRPTHGSVFLDGQDVFQLSETALAELRNRRIGFVFQFHHLLPEFTAIENTCLPALIQKCPKEEAYARAKVLLTEVGLANRLHHKPGELSGGEQQRVAVARALIRHPDLVLADEPTGNLDAHTGETLFELLRDVNRKKGTAFVIVTHNERLAKKVDRLIVMKDGRITEHAPGLMPVDT